MKPGQLLSMETCDSGASLPRLLKWAVSSPQVWELKSLELLRGNSGQDGHPEHLQKCFPVMCTVSKPDIAKW